MPQPLIAGLPPGLALPAGYQLRVNAIDPTSGANVTGLTVSNFSIFATNLVGTDASELEAGPFLLVPSPDS
jgi:hypothetical protein